MIISNTGTEGSDSGDLFLAVKGVSENKSWVGTVEINGLKAIASFHVTSAIA